VLQSSARKVSSAPALDDGQGSLCRFTAHSLAALRIARDLVSEKIVSPSEALALLASVDLDEIDETGIEVPAGSTPIATGTSAGLGAAVGMAIFDPDRVMEVGCGKYAVILVCEPGQCSAPIDTRAAYG